MVNIAVWGSLGELELWLSITSYLDPLHVNDVEFMYTLANMQWQMFPTSYMAV